MQNVDVVSLAISLYIYSGIKICFKKLTSETCMQSLNVATVIYNGYNSKLEY